VTTVSAFARRSTALRLPKVDSRLVVGLLLVALSVLGGLRIASTADDTVAVYAATRDLPADHVLTRDDVRVTRIEASDTVIDGLVSARHAPPTGRVLRFPIAEGGLLAGASVGGAHAGADGREITVPIGADHALGGALAPGDRVDVLGSFDKGTELAKTLTVAKSAQVVDVVSSDGLFGQRDGELSAITLSVKPDDVVLVAFALRNGEVDVVRAARPGKSVRSRFDVSELP
jgi:Flp pilus assembly protein CpaB